MTDKRLSRLAPQEWADKLAEIDRLLAVSKAAGAPDRERRPLILERARMFRHKPAGCEAAEADEAEMAECWERMWDSLDEAAAVYGGTLLELLAVVTEIVAGEVPRVESKK